MLELAKRSRFGGLGIADHGTDYTTNTTAWAGFAARAASSFAPTENQMNPVATGCAQALGKAKARRISVRFTAAPLILGDDSSPELPRLFPATAGGTHFHVLCQGNRLAFRQAHGDVLLHQCRADMLRRLFHVLSLTPVDHIFASRIPGITLVNRGLLPAPNDAGAREPGLGISQRLAGEAHDTIDTCQVSGSVQRTAANPARSGRKQR